MANNIKGITIEIGGNTTKLTDALKDVDKAAKSTRNNLSEIDRALKYDPSNVELLSQKYDQLGKAVNAAREKLQTLEEAKRQAADALERGDITTEQYQALTREVILQTQAVNDAEKAYNSFNVEAEAMKAKLDGVSGKAAEVAEKTKALSAAAGALLVTIGGAALKSAEWADDLNTLSKQTGISTEDLQKMQFAAAEVDVSVEDITGAMRKMTQAMASEGKQDVFAQLGVSVRDSTGAMRDSSDVFYELLDHLSHVGNETERDQLAMELFGKSANELAGIIDDGGASLRALGDEAANLGLILDQETLDAMNRVNDQVDRLKATAKADFMKAGAAALEALTPVIEKVIDAISRVLEFIGNMSPQMIEVITVIAAVVAAISPVAGIIAKITTAASTLITVFPALAGALEALPFVAIVAGAVLLYKALEALAEYIYKNWDKIKEKLETAKEFVVAIFEAIRDKVKEKINAVIDFINSAIEAVNNLIQKLNNSLLGKFFGLNVRTIGTVPALASGGSLASGSALVGERGPELLTMANGRANVQPLSTTTNTYNTINQTSRQPVQVNLSVDGMTLARALWDPMKQVGQQYGPSFVRE